MGPARRGGFTLIELVVVIIILAIVAAVVIPQAVSGADLQARSAARMIMADLEYAQNQAIVTQADTTVTFDTGGNSYVVSNESGTLIHPITKKAYTVDFAVESGLGRVSIASAVFGDGSAVTFNALGAPSSDGTVTVVAGAHGYQVIVAAVTGRVRVCAAP